MSNPRRSSRMKKKVDPFQISGQPTRLRSTTDGGLEKECDNAPSVRLPRTCTKRAVEAIKEALACEMEDNSSNDSSDFVKLPDPSFNLSSSDDEELIRPARIYDSKASKKELPLKDCGVELSEYEKRIAENARKNADFLAALLVNDDV